MSSTGGLSQARLDRLRGVMSGYVERGEVPGIVALISRRGEVCVETAGTLSLGGSTPIRRDTIFRIASVSKPIVAAAAMILVEECRLRLDEPVDRLLPELANRRVLKSIDGPLEDTVPANRSITLRDLLTLRMGLGHLTSPESGDYPIRRALTEQQLLLGPPKPQDLPPPDEWIRRVGTLPLVDQPGEKWMYDLGIDVLGVLIARAAEQPLELFLRERLFQPLGMRDTGFYVPAEKIDRFATSYASDPETGGLALYDEAREGHWSRPPAFPSASGGLVSTADDLLAFGQMMLNGGRHGSERILSRLSVEAMTSDQLTPEQKAGNEIFFGDNRSWGFGLSMITRQDGVATVPGQYGWDGGLGTSWYVDPREEMIGVLLTQRAWDSPQPPPIRDDFWTTAYAAVDD